MQNACPAALPRNSGSSIVRRRTGQGYMPVARIKANDDGFRSRATPDVGNAELPASITTTTHRPPSAHPAWLLRAGCGASRGRKRDAAPSEGLVISTQNEPMLFRRSEVDGLSIFYCEAREQAALNLPAPVGVPQRGAAETIFFRGRRDEFFTRKGAALPENLPRRGNAPPEFWPFRCRRLLPTVDRKMSLLSQCRTCTMLTGCVLRFVSFVGPLCRLIWFRILLSLKQRRASDQAWLERRHH
jgi:hypothetical protein